MTADEIIAHFDLSPHPEGGWYRQTWVAESILARMEPVFTLSPAKVR